MKEIKSKDVCFTKRLFVGIIDAIEKQHRHDLNCCNKLAHVFPDASVMLYDNTIVMDKLQDLIRVLIKDTEKWVDCYMWELDFGREYTEGCVKINGEDVPLRNASDLWNLIVSYYKE